MVCVNCEGPRSDLDSVSGRPTLPSWAGAPAGAWPKAVAHRDNKLGHGDSHTRESVHIALRQTLMASVGVFPKSGWGTAGWGRVKETSCPILCLTGEPCSEKFIVPPVKFDFTCLPGA